MEDRGLEQIKGPSCPQAALRPYPSAISQEEWSLLPGDWKVYSYFIVIFCQTVSRLWPFLWPAARSRVASPPTHGSRPSQPGGETENSPCVRVDARRLAWPGEWLSHLPADCGST